MRYSTEMFNIFMVLMIDKNIFEYSFFVMDDEVRITNISEKNIGEQFI